MLKVSTDHVFYSFSGNNEPAMTVDAPAEVVFETMDCFGNKLCRPEDKMCDIPIDLMNPATGPVFVNGAEPGDALQVTIEEIALAPQGVVCCENGEGPLGETVEGSHTRIVRVSDGLVHYMTADGQSIEIPARPMIGVIGVAPSDGQSINTETPGAHGSNMDNTMMGEGAVLYLPVSEPGALFGLGDLHAVMGDGEVGITGLEIAGTVRVKLDVVKGKAPSWPILETDEHISVIVSRPTLDEACQTATEAMEQLLQSRTDLSVPDIVMLMGLVGDLQICQIVDPQMTVRFVFPKKYIPQLTF